MLLSRHNRILNVSTIGQGSKHMTIVDIGYLTTLALLSGATAVILCHNHPSGNHKPSKEDKALTQKIKSALRLFDIELLDHIIITTDNECWYSMAAQGEI